MEGSMRSSQQRSALVLFVPVIFFAWSGGILEPKLPLLNAGVDTNLTISKISHFLMKNLNSETGPVSTQFALAPTGTDDGFNLNISLQENEDQAFTMVATDDATEAIWFQVNRLSDVDPSILLRSQFQGHWEPKYSVETNPALAGFIQFAVNGGNPLTAYFNLSTQHIVLMDCEPAKCHGRMGLSLVVISNCNDNRVREFSRISEVTM